MIVNEPTAQDLNSYALRAHFSAWEILIEVVNTFEDHTYFEDYESDAAWEAERQAYLRLAKAESQTIYSLIAQANELQMRARVCEISPFLLLVNTENRFKAAGGSIDFTELRTVDAVDLPMLVNAIAKTKISPEFQTFFNQIRSIRNKIVHLGAISDHFDTNRIVGFLTFQYAELWGGVGFFKNWAEYSTRTRHAHFFDKVEYTPLTSVLASIPTLEGLLTKGQFKRLFGFPSSVRRFICYQCCDAAGFQRQDRNLEEYKTAKIVNDNEIFCACCESRYPVKRTKCNNADCKGNVLYDVEKDWQICLSCGHGQ